MRRHKWRRDARDYRVDSVGEQFEGGQAAILLLEHLNQSPMPIIEIRDRSNISIVVPRPRRNVRFLAPLRSYHHGSCIQSRRAS
jgi:hypothetical protein